MQEQNLQTLDAVPLVITIPGTYEEVPDTPVTTPVTTSVTLKAVEIIEEPEQIVANVTSQIVNVTSATAIDSAVPSTSQAGNSAPGAINMGTSSRSGSLQSSTTIRGSQKVTY